MISKACNSTLEEFICFVTALYNASYELDISPRHELSQYDLMAKKRNNCLNPLMCIEAPIEQGGNG